MRWLTLLVFAVFTLSGVATCGQKGPLTLPEESRLSVAVTTPVRV